MNDPGTFTATEPDDREEPDGSPQPGPAPRAAAAQRPRSGALRHVLRLPVAAALLFCGALHLPVEAAAPAVMTPADFLPLPVAVVCLGLGAVLAVRDTPA
ncbi:hypothetical protein ACWCY1_25190, partial [Streptomyces goshikiensis]